jgi:hypothetical protein
VSSRLSFRRLAANWELKLAALAMAVVLWAVASAEQDASWWLPVRVEAVVRDPGYELVGEPVPSTVRVRFAGPRHELWNLGLRPPALVMEVHEVGGSGLYRLSPQMVRLPERLAADPRLVRPEAVNPAVVRLDVRPLAGHPSGTRAGPVPAAESRGDTAYAGARSSLPIGPAAADSQIANPLDSAHLPIVRRDSAATASPVRPARIDSARERP